MIIISIICVLLLPILFYISKRESVISDTLNVNLWKTIPPDHAHEVLVRRISPDGIERFNVASYTLTHQGNVWVASIEYPNKESYSTGLWYSEILEDVVEWKEINQ